MRTCLAATIPLVLIVCGSDVAVPPGFASTGEADAHADVADNEPDAGSPEPPPPPDAAFDVAKEGAVTRHF